MTLKTSKKLKMRFSVQSSALSVQLNRMRNLIPQTEYQAPISYLHAITPLKYPIDSAMPGRGSFMSFSNSRLHEPE